MRFVLLLFFIINTSVIQAQMLTPEVIACSGGEYSNAYASMSVTIGETVTETISGQDYMLTQGFQQSSYIRVNINEQKNKEFEVVIYPNPVKDVLNVKFFGDLSSYTVIRISNVLGNVLYTRPVHYNEKNIVLDIADLSAGVYMLQIIDKNSIETVRIIKR